jgi:hypothetical protein
MERRNGLVQHPAQTAQPGDPAFAAAFAETLDDRAGLRVAHDVADVDRLGRLGERQAAALAANVGEPPVSAQEMDHFGQMMRRHPEGSCDLRDGGAPLRLRGEVDQHAQAVVGEGCELHGGASQSCQRGAVRPA